MIDDSVCESDYYEDCYVCCRPIRVQVDIDFEGDFRVIVSRDDE
jgi:hypothetical protein